MTKVSTSLSAAGLRGWLKGRRSRAASADSSNAASATVNRKDRRGVGSDETGREAPHRVVIIGAGFGGLAAARALEGAPVSVTLIDKRNYHTFQPLLYEVATAGLDPADVAYPIRAVLGRASNVQFRLGAVTGVDWTERRVCFGSESLKNDQTREGCAEDLEFDTLIVASGAVVNFFGVPGANEYAMPLYTLDDARHLRNHILRRLEDADEAGESSDGMLNFVVVGGGPTGVEISGAIGDLLDLSLERDGFRFDRSKVRIVVVDGLDHLLGSFKVKAQGYAEETLRSRGVEFMLGEMVSRISATEVELKDGTIIPTRTVIWAGGVTVNGTMASTIGSETTRGGRLVVDSNLSVGTREGVLAIGDAAAIPRAFGSNDICPQLSPVAIQSGRHAASIVISRQLGQPTAPFRYHDKGTMATIGRRAAVAQLNRGPLLRGTIGWAAWFGLHIVYLIGFRNRVTVIVNWTWRYLNWTSGPRIIAGDDPAAQNERLVPPACSLHDSGHLSARYGC
jgi:NADH:ubiquinone reductase (H+-translocating)